MPDVLLLGGRYVAASRTTDVRPGRYVAGKSGKMAKCIICPGNIGVWLADYWRNCRLGEIAPCTLRYITHPGIVRNCATRLSGYFVFGKAKEMLTNKKRLKNTWKIKKDDVGL
jgi:hypothetical protein